MKTYIMIIGFLFLISIVIAQEPDSISLDNSSEYPDWNSRIEQLENNLTREIEKLHENQALLTGEMHRLNDKLENRFDKYFLWGYGTLLVVISTLVSVVFNKQRTQNTVKETNLLVK